MKCPVCNYPVAGRTSSGVDVLMEHPREFIYIGLVTKKIGEMPSEESASLPGKGIFKGSPLYACPRCGSVRTEVKP